MHLSINWSPLKKKLWISHIMVFLAPILFFATFGYFWIANSIESNSTRHYMTMMKSSVIEIDRSIGQIHSLAGQFRQTFWVQKIVNMQGDTLDSSRLSAYDLQEYRQSLYACATSIDIANEMGLYFPQKDFVVSSSGNSSLEFMLENYLKISSMAPEDWKTLVNGLTAGEPSLYPVEQVYRYGMPNGQGILYLEALQPSTSTYPGCILFAFLPNSKLEKQLAALIQSDEFLGLSISAQDTVFFNIANNGIDRHPIQVAAFSDATEWEYSLQLSSSVIMKDISAMRNVLLLFAFGLLLFCFFVTVVSSTRIASPIQELLLLLQTKADPPPERNEMGFINHRIRELLNERENLRHQIDRQLPELISYYLAMLSTAPPTDAPRLLEEMDSLMLPKERACWNCCLLTLKSSSGLQLAVQPISFILLELQKLPFEDMEIYPARVGGRLLFLVHYNQAEQFTAWIVKLLEQFPESIASLGEQVASMEEIPASIRQAQTISNYRISYSGYRVLRWPKENETVPYYYFPAEKESQFSVCLRTGNYESSKTIIREICERNKVDPRVGPDAVAACLGSIGQILQRIAAEAGLVVESPGISENADLLLEQVKKVCSAIQANSGQRALILNNIAEYIDSSLYDGQLSLQYVGEHFGVSASFISKAFKEKKGQNFLTYVHSRRVEFAKELLLQNYDAVEVARMVGYDSDATFRRIFKSYVGVTPKAFREQTTIAP